MQKNYKKEEKIKEDSHFYTLILTNYVYSEDDRANNDTALSNYRHRANNSSNHFTFDIRKYIVRHFSVR